MTARASADQVDVLIVGGGLGGVAAAMALCDHGHRVLMVDEYPWIGGQLTAQAVPPDEHKWIETTSPTRSYQRLRERIREHYRRNYPLTAVARDDSLLNPGRGTVSRLCHEPRVAVGAIYELLAPFLAAGNLEVWTQTRVVEVETANDTINAVRLATPLGERHVQARICVDATERGDIIALAGAEHVVGAEAQVDTGEPHAPAVADPFDQQSMTWCFALEWGSDDHHVIDRPHDYERWRSLDAPYTDALQFSWSGVDPTTLQHRLMGLFEGDLDGYRVPDMWHYRRVLARSTFEIGAVREVSMVNWHQTDYWLRPTVTPDLHDDRAQFERAAEEAKQLSRSFLYWLQTEAPNQGGGVGYPTLRLRPDITGTSDGFAMAPYIRESRRIVGLGRVSELDIGVDARGHRRPEAVPDTVGIGHYRIDLHPSASGRNFVDVDCFPFQIPARAMLPVRMRNLLPANKNIGTTHITNGAFRLHPVEWSIGEAVGVMAAACLRNATPVQALAHPQAVETIQGELANRGTSLSWPDWIVDDYPRSRTLFV
ncbi:FAD-dependent oxidoreductase [Ruania alkalisoli]|uniref:FAD-dependent oxidoreductase n=1 Tax=Ruania alkalisoli TaxID=2779775 RepID=A0A7M1STC5_9MICO|nr:FAD-dependent oxidoreductase [Ruania alkalisoli]QOR70810.1 FAD-dependent oxidoreductase [Ruania alkalisoli]